MFCVEYLSNMEFKGLTKHIILYSIITLLIPVIWLRGTVLGVKLLRQLLDQIIKIKEFCLVWTFDYWTIAFMPLKPLFI